MAAQKSGSGWPASSATAAAGRRRAPTLPTPAAWARRTEAQSLKLPAALLKEARANTRAAAGDVGFLATLAREVALSRGHELTLAFGNLVWVLPGFRKKRVLWRADDPRVDAKAAPRPRITSELCVVFVVRRKGSVAEGHAQHLPRWLITFAERHGQRMPFALPTDVQDASEFHAARAHAQSAVSVKNGNLPAANGSFACVVNLTYGAGQQLCLLSAQHVLTPFAEDGAAVLAEDLVVMPLDSTGSPQAHPVLALSLPFGGELRNDERPDRPSFDLQLARIEDLSAVRQRTAVVRLNAGMPWARNLLELMELDKVGWFYLLPPDNHHETPGRGSVRLTVSAMPPSTVGLQYTFVGASAEVTRTVYHAELLRFEAKGSKVALNGDSGSPIVARRDDGTLTLVAMHIGGDSLGVCWAIPAWDLFNMQRWMRYPPGAAVMPVEP